MQGAALVALLFVLGACAVIAPTRRVTEEERQAYAAAVSEVETDPADAARRLETFLREHPESPLVDDAAEKRADLALARGDAATAAQWLRYALEHEPEGDRSDAVRVRLAQLEAREGNPASARQRLEDDVRWSMLDPAEKRAGYRLLADLVADPVARLRWLAALHAATPEDEREAVEAELQSQLAALSPEELERAAEQLREGDAAARVRVRLAERALEAGDLDAARDELRRARRRAVSDSARAAADELEVRLETQERFAAGTGVLPTFAEVAALPAPRTDGASGTIGVVLPLTGPFARYGEAALRGVLLAAGVFEPVDGVPQRELPEEGLPAAVSMGPTGGPGRVRVLVRDSAGGPERAARAVRELAAREDVVAIVGPLRSQSADAAARVAEEEDVPLVALSIDPDVARGREQVVRLRSSAVDEVQALVEHAMGSLGARRFAILYPEDAYGMPRRRLFWQAVEQRGGEVVAVAGYQRGATDFAEPIRRMIGYALLSDAEKRALRERARDLEAVRRLPPEKQRQARHEILARPGPDGRPLPPIVDFDALFIPDSHEKVVLIAPQLAFHEVDGVQLLGPDLWDHPDLVRMEGRHVEGAVVATTFYEDSRFPFVADFVERYRGAYGLPPDAYAAVGYDAANLVLVQLAYGADERDELRRGLLRTTAYPGVSGVTAILPDGNARKRSFLLRVEREGFQGID